MLSKKLRQLRKEYKMTQTELAEKFGVSQQALAKWEAGRALPETETISRIAGFFSITTDYLLGLSDSFAPLGPASKVKIIGTVKAGFNALAIEEDLGSALAEVEDAEEYRYLIVKATPWLPISVRGTLPL